MNRDEGDERPGTAYGDVLAGLDFQPEICQGSRGCNGGTPEWVSTCRSCGIQTYWCTNCRISFMKVTMLMKATGMTPTPVRCWGCGALSEDVDTAFDFVRIER